MRRDGATRRRAASVFAAALVGAATLGAAPPAAAQRAALGVRAGAGVGGYTGTEAGWERVPGPAAAVTGELQVLPFATAYLGLEWIRFGCEDGYCTGRDARLTSRGATLGIRWSVPGVEPRPWLRTAVAFHQLELEASGTERTDAAPGFEIAAGILHRIRPSVYLAPEVAYLQHAAVTTTSDGDAATVALGLGVVWTPGGR